MTILNTYRATESTIIYKRRNRVAAAGLFGSHISPLRLPTSLPISHLSMCCRNSIPRAQPHSHNGQCSALGGVPTLVPTVQLPAASICRYGCDHMPPRRQADSVSYYGHRVRVAFECSWHKASITSCFRRANAEYCEYKTGLWS